MHRPVNQNGELKMVWLFLVLFQPCVLHLQVPHTIFQYGNLPNRHHLKNCSFFFLHFTRSFFLPRSFFNGLNYCRDRSIVSINDFFFRHHPSICVLLIPHAVSVFCFWCSFFLPSIITPVVFLLNFLFLYIFAVCVPFSCCYYDFN